MEYKLQSGGQQMAEMVGACATTLEGMGWERAFMHGGDPTGKITVGRRVL